jgi:hypothetical protein
MSLRVASGSLLPRPCQSQRVASRTEWRRPGRWGTTRAGSARRFCQGARPPRHCYSHTWCGSLWGCRRWTWRRLQETEKSWILCLLGTVHRKKCKLTNETNWPAVSDPNPLVQLRENSMSSTTKAGRIKSIKISTDTIGNRNRDLPESAVPQPTAPLRTPCYFYHYHISVTKLGHMLIRSELLLG